MGTERKDNTALTSLELQMRIVVGLKKGLVVLERFDARPLVLAGDSGPNTTPWNACVGRAIGKLPANTPHPHERTAVVAKVLSNRVARSRVLSRSRARTSASYNDGQKASGRIVVKIYSSRVLSLGSRKNPVGRGIAPRLAVLHLPAADTVPVFGKLDETSLDNVAVEVDALAIDGIAVDKGNSVVGTGREEALPTTKSRVDSRATNWLSSARTLRTPLD